MRAVTFSFLMALVSVNAFTVTELSKSRVGLITRTYGYVPSGFTEESYKKFKADEEAKKKKANLGKLGPRGFQSRSFQSFQEALERGEAEHLLPVFDAKGKLKRGEIKKTDIPYMQRGGKWDDSDVKGAQKKKWLNSDKEYYGGGYKKEQSASILGFGSGLDWTGTQGRQGPAETVRGKAPKFGRNYKAPNVNDMKDLKNDTPKKKLFGLF